VQARLPVDSSLSFDIGEFLWKSFEKVQVWKIGQEYGELNTNIEVRFIISFRRREFAMKSFIATVYIFLLLLTLACSSTVRIEHVVVLYVRCLSFSTYSHFSLTLLLRVFCRLYLHHSGCHISPVTAHCLFIQVVYLGSFAISIYFHCYCSTDLFVVSVWRENNFFHKSIFELDLSHPSLAASIIIAVWKIKRFLRTYRYGR